MNLTAADARNRNRHPQEFSIYSSTAARATWATQVHFRSAAQHDSNDANAFKHAYWNALLVLNFYIHHKNNFNGTEDEHISWAVERARFWASGHEDYTPWDQADEARRMDYVNNNEGRYIARISITRNFRVSEAEHETAVLQALRGRRTFRVLFPDSLR